MNPLNKVVIFGATSAIAQHVARKLVARGASVFCVGRNEKKLEVVVQDLKVRAGNSENVHGCTADLTDESRHLALIEQAATVLGHIDAVLVAHGSLPDQAQCQKDLKALRSEFDTNACSVISLLTVSANYLEPRGKGVLAVIGSVAGDRGRQSNYVYGAAKAAVATFAEGLQHRLSVKGVDVVTIKPGFVDTPMTDGMDKSGLLWAQPDRVADGIIRAMERGQRVSYLPWFWWGIMAIIRNIPEPIFRRMRI